ncbi:FkbM family methyltransferase [Pseudoalteromonas piscicida]|uniref:Methyltransferase FkbM domain-containing protein n=1 Tax=Pseudoalteromonas piscicida TaxID=43662 RepID=A0ABM6NAE1_PSEO7|nr:FkbM family methyltransferase [Pseudoalteromonas piscicida]ATD05827.1 hypothetical protein PPIS_a0552 [Pseudoalteromonas piscicida]WPU32612.1 FkbM family methyltransferase [Pseudoalteromonas piscicida]
MNIQDSQFYIYGASHYGQVLAAYLLEKGLKPRAILDKSPKFNDYMGIPCHAFPNDKLDKCFPVIISILGYAGVEKSLLESGFDQIVSTLDSFDLFPAALKRLNKCGVLWMQPSSDLVDESKCAKVLSLLSDQQSRDTYNLLVNYRVSPCRDNYPLPEQYEMYFPDDIPKLYKYEKMRVLDIGAYDGDTLAGFFQRYAQTINHYAAVEVSTKNIKLLESRLKAMGDATEYVSIYRKAVGLPENKKLLVKENLSATYVSVIEEGEVANVSEDCLVESINLSELTAMTQCNVIKMDIEGADYDALVQCRDYIAECTPTLALSLYHRSEDLWEIPLLIESFAANRYHYYVRQEGHWLLETQFYAVPKDK